MSPSKQEMRFAPEYAAELLRIAEGDHATAVALKNASGIRIENAFYMAQQAIEKALKAVLITLNLPVPLVHDLGILLARIPAEYEPPFGYELSELNQYAAMRRYQEGYWTPTLEEFAIVLDKTRQMLDWAQKLHQEKSKKS
jgi:HEPN domain-containing protein